MTRSRLIVLGAVLLAAALAVFAGLQAHLAASTAMPALTLSTPP